MLVDGRNQSPMGVRDALQDIAGQKLSIQNSDEVYIQIVGKTSLKHDLLGLGYACIGVPFPCVMCHSLFADG